MNDYSYWVVLERTSRMWRSDRAHRVKWRHSNLWSHYDIYVVWQRGVLREWIGKDLSRYSNKIESFGLRKCPLSYCIRKWCYNSKHFSELAPHHGEKTAGIDMVWRNYVAVCHPVYLRESLRTSGGDVRDRCSMSRTLILRLHDTAGCQTGCQTGLTTGCIV